MSADEELCEIKQRFRGFLPVIIDVETGGFNAQTDALLEVAATIVRMEPDGELYVHETVHHNVVPFEGANLEASALEFTGIDPYHPFREALSEADALESIFKTIRKEIKSTH